MTPTTLINGQSVGTGANIGNNILSQAQTAFQASTTAFVITAKLTNGNGPVDPGQQIRIWYTSTQHTVTAGNAPTQLNKTARYVDVKPNPGANAVTINDSALEPITGANLNLWCDVATYPLAGTLTVILVELP